MLVLTYTPAIGIAYSSCKSVHSAQPYGEFANWDRSNQFGVGDDYSTIASLTHTVTFHADGLEMEMIDPKTGEARWFCQEAWTGGSRHGRGLHQSRMWREDGLHVATTMQDGMLRLKTEDGTGKPGFGPRITEHMGTRGKPDEKL